MRGEGSIELKGNQTKTGHCRVCIHGHRGTLPLGCMESGADETPSSLQKARITHSDFTLVQAFSGISHKTLHPAFLIPC
jgi:hypothetical protein